MPDCPSGHAPHDISPRVETTLGGNRQRCLPDGCVAAFCPYAHLHKDSQCAATSSAAKRSSSRLASSCMDLRHSGTQQLRKAGSDRYRVVWDAMGVWDAMARCSTHGIGHPRGTQRVLNGHNWCMGAMEYVIGYSGPGLAGWLLLSCDVACCKLQCCIVGVWDAPRVWRMGSDTPAATKLMYILRPVAEEMMSWLRTGRQTPQHAPDNTLVCNMATADISADGEADQLCKLCTLHCHWERVSLGRRRIGATECGVRKA